MLLYCAALRAHAGAAEPSCTPPGAASVRCGGSAGIAPSAAIAAMSARAPSLKLRSSVRPAAPHISAAGGSDPFAAIAAITARAPSLNVRSSGAPERCEMWSV